MRNEHLELDDEESAYLDGEEAGMRLDDVRPDEDPGDDGNRRDEDPGDDGNRRDEDPGDDGNRRDGDPESGGSSARHLRGSASVDPASQMEASTDCLSQLLADVAAFYKRFVVFSSEASSVAVALWTLHTHVVSALDTTPYLYLRSAQKQSGKTRVLEIAELLVPRPWRVVETSEAAVFRIVEQRRPTLLLDEVDATFGGRDSKEGLRAILNAGFRKGSSVPRVEGDSKSRTVREFDVFCAKAFAGIGRLPETLVDRSITIDMKRKLKSEFVERYRERKVRKLAAPLKQRLSLWGGETTLNLMELLDREIEMPEVLSDRACDLWEPLLAIACLAGDDWSVRAVDAAIALSGQTRETNDLSIQLLIDIKEVFSDSKVDALHTHQLLTNLVAIETSRWGEFWADDLKYGHSEKPAARVARLLEPYEIQPKQMKIGGTNRRGYRVSDFVDAWARYLPASALSPIPTIALAAPVDEDSTAPSRSVAGVAPVASAQTEREFEATEVDVDGWPRIGVRLAHRNERHDADDAERHDADDAERHDADGAERHDADGAERHDADGAEHHEADDAERHDADDALDGADDHQEDDAAWDPREHFSEEVLDLLNLLDAPQQDSHDELDGPFPTAADEELL